MEEKLYTTKQARELLGLSADVMRAYLIRGLIPNLKRSRTGRIMLAKWQLDWLQVLTGLRRAGFTMEELKQYTRLCRRGEKTLAERKAMVETKRQQAWRELEECQKRVDILTRKEDYLEQILMKKVELPTNWI